MPEKNSLTAKPEVSVIIPVYNQLEYTVTAIESIDKTLENKRIIVINNNSDSETTEYLNKQNNIELINNPENLGFPKAVNQGIIRAGSDFVIIANSDIILPEGSLKRMIQVAKSAPEIGIVSGMSNYASGPQLDQDANYTSIDDMHEYAKKVRRENAGQIFVFPRVIFLCTLIKRQVIDKIGGLDERFSPGNFEDDDYCLRSHLAGFKTVIAKDVFIHHFGSKSFAAEGRGKLKNLLEVNRAKFVDKWGGNPVQIWLEGKRVKNRSLIYPIDNNEVAQFLNRANIHIADKEYVLAHEALNSCISAFNDKTVDSKSSIKKADVLTLRETLASALNINQK